MMVLCDPRKPKLLWDRQQQLEEDCQGEEEKWEEEQGKDDQGEEEQREGDQGGARGGRLLGERGHP